MKLNLADAGADAAEDNGATARLIAAAMVDAAATADPAVSGGPARWAGAALRCEAEDR